MIDMTELEAMEDLINQGSDAQVEAWRVSQLSVCGMIAIIVELLFSIFSLEGSSRCVVVALKIVVECGMKEQGNCGLLC